MIKPRTSAELREVAERVVWFEPPDETLRLPVRFLAYVMAQGSVKDIRAARQAFSRDEFLEALQNAPAGIFSPRIWAYWNLMLDCEPPLPIPEREVLQGQHQNGENCRRSGQ